LKRDGGYAQQHVTRLGELLRVLHQKWSEDDLLTTGLSASSANIQLHGELSDDEMREWAEFKKELSKMFKNITQLEPELVAQYIIQLMPQLPDLIRKSSLNDGHKAQSELAGLLNMFYLMAEALQPEVLKNNVKFFMQVLATLTEHHVDQLTQRTVATQYFEIASRCSRLLASQPASPEHQQLIGAILAAFLSPQSGIRSPLASTRARHCYLFKNFVTNLLSHLGSFTAMIINNLKDLFQFDQTTLDYRLEDKLDLFEAVSKLVGSSQDVALQQQSLLYLVSPAIQRIEEIVAQQLYKQDPPNNPRHLVLLANLIQSIGTFSKGFPSKQIQPPIAALWQSATQVVIKTYEQLPTHAEIFKQVIFFFHRMVECLGALLLPYLNLFVPLLLTHLQNVPQFGDFIMLVAQMNDTFEDKMCDVVSALYLPLCDRVTSALAHESQVTPGSEDERELNELKKTYYYFLSSVCEHKLLPVLVAPAHMPRFEQVLKLVLAGCTYWTEPTTQRRCFTILRLLSEKLGGTQPSSLQGFNAFILQHVIKACFEVPLSPRFNLDDGTSITVLTEIVTLQKSVQTVCGEEFTNFMLNVLLPELKMTPDTAVTYLNTLKSSAINDFRNYLRAFFKQNRGSS
jgi:exportin-T